MNRFWWKFIRILILWMHKYFTLISMTSKVIQGHKSSSNFCVNPTLPLMDGPLMSPSQIVCISLSLTLHLVLYFSYPLSISLSTSLFCSMQTFLKVTWGHFYVAWFLMIFRSFDQITTLTYFNLNLRSYGQIFVLTFKVRFGALHIKG